MAKVLIDNDEGTVRIEFRDVAELDELPDQIADELTGDLVEPWWSGRCGRCGQEITDRGNPEDSLMACMNHADRCGS